MAFCDGSCVLTLDTAAAANAEAPSPHRGALASPLGLVRVSDCPEAHGAPEAFDSGPAGVSSAEGFAKRPQAVHHIVKGMLASTHAVPQFRR